MSYNTSAPKKLKLSLRDVGEGALVQVNLTEDCLTEIFALTDVRTLLVLTTVCKEFYNIITKNKLINRKLTLAIDYTKPRESLSSIFDALARSTRPFSSFSLDLTVNDSKTDLLKNLEMYKDHAETLTIKNNFYVNQSTLNIFNMLPNLREISFDNVIADYSFNPMSNIPQLKKLKKLSLTGSLPSFMCVLAKEIEDLAIILEYPDGLFEFAMRLKKLKILRIDIENTYWLNISETDSCDFKLKKLYMVLEEGLNIDKVALNYINMVELLLKSQDELEIISLTGINVTSETLNQCLLLKSLKKLKINYKSDLLQSRQICSSLTDFDLFYNGSDLTSLEKFLKRFPNLKKLNLTIKSLEDTPLDDLINIDHEHLKGNCKIKIIGNGSVAKQIKCKGLSSLALRRANLDKVDWLVILDNNPNIDSLDLADMELSFDSLMVIVNTLGPLKSLQFHPNLTSDHSLNIISLEYILQNCNQLEILNVELTGCKEQYQKLFEKYSEKLCRIREKSFFYGWLLNSRQVPNWTTDCIPTCFTCRQNTVIKGPSTVEQPSNSTTNRILTRLDRPKTVIELPSRVERPDCILTRYSRRRNSVVKRPSTVEQPSLSPKSSRNRVKWNLN